MDDWDSLEELIRDVNISTEVTENTAELDRLAKEARVPTVAGIIRDDYKMCCGVYGQIADGFILCIKCGIERPWNENEYNSITSIDLNYTTSSNSYTRFNIVGRGCQANQRMYMQVCANYELYRNNFNRKEIMTRIFQSGKKISVTVIEDAVEIFEQIKQRGYVFRGNGKWSVIAACLFYTCIKHGLTKTPREIAAIMSIPDKFLSHGDKIMQELNELGVISIPTIFRPIGDYIDQFFPQLGIPMKYKDFVIALVARAEKKHLNIHSESRTTTKCIGAIYMLCKRVPSLRHIKKEHISTVCGISKSTFIRNYNQLRDNPAAIKPTFIKYNINMPVEWKNIKA